MGSKTSEDTIEQIRTPYIVLLLLAIGLSGYLLVHHLKVSEGIQVGGSICSISKNFDCDVVARSAHSTWLGIPVASFALLFYLTLLSFVLFARAKFGVLPEVFDRLMFLFALLSLPPSFYLLYLMASVIGTFCIFCTILDFINVLLVIVSMRWLHGRQPYVKALLDGVKDIGKFISIALLIKPCVGHKRLQAIVALVSLMLLTLSVYLSPLYLSQYVFAAQKVELQKVLKSELELWTTQWLALSPSEAPIIATFPMESADFIKGPLSARISIIEFADFQCPHCRRASSYLAQLIEKYKPRINIVFKNYPLDSSCNGYMGHPGNPTSCFSAYLAICAGFEDSQLFWQAHDALFDLGIYTESSLEKLAAELGLSSTLGECASNPSIVSRVRQEIELANRLEVSGTPAVFIYADGKIMRVRNLALLESVIGWFLAKE